MSNKSYPEWDRMVSGELSHPDPIIAVRIRRTREILRRYNTSSEDPALRKRILEELFDQPFAADDLINIEPPFYCDFGLNITIGKNFFANFDCVILDCGPVTIGDDVWFGPKVQIYTPSHPIDPGLRRKRIEFTRPVVIGNTVWIGGGAIVLPGVTIGENSVIGAGSVVTHDIPANVVAAGNPCQILREISVDE